MGKLMALERRATSFRPYRRAALACGLTAAAFLYLMAVLARLEPGDPDMALFAAYGSLVSMTHLVSLALFTLLGTALGARLVVEGYRGERAILLLSYPIPRKKLFGAKLAWVFLYPASSMFLWGLVTQGFFLGTQVLFPLCPGGVTAGAVLGGLASLLCCALLAGLLSWLALWFGLRRGTVSGTIVAGVAAVCLVCQAMGATLAVPSLGWLLLLAAAGLAGLAAKRMLRQIETMEV